MKDDENEMIQLHKKYETLSLHMAIKLCYIPLTFCICTSKNKSLALIGNYCKYCIARLGM